MQSPQQLSAGAGGLGRISLQMRKWRLGMAVTLLAGGLQELHHESETPSLTLMGLEQECTFVYRYRSHRSSLQRSECILFSYLNVHLPIRKARFPCRTPRHLGICINSDSVGGLASSLQPQFQHTSLSLHSDSIPYREDPTLTHAHLWTVQSSAQAHPPLQHPAVPGSSLSVHQCS